MGAHLILEGEELLVVWNLLGEGVRRVYFLRKKKRSPMLFKNRNKVKKRS